MRKAGEITYGAIEAVKAIIAPGVSTLELSKVAHDYIVAHDATPSFLGYGGFPEAICTSVNDVVVHGIPTKERVLHDGDIISIDCGACYQGYHGDSAWTFVVGQGSIEVKRLVEVTEAALYAGLSQVKAGQTLGSVSFAIGDYVTRSGYSIPLAYTGHGIGAHLHEDPNVPNLGKPNQGIILKENMTLAIEPIVMMGKSHTRVASDKWTVIAKDKQPSAHMEHTIRVTKDGYEILTKNKEDDRH